MHDTRTPTCTLVQEKPNDIPEGETPHNVTMYVYEGNVDLCRPGDRVTITGTYRAQVRTCKNACLSVCVYACPLYWSDW